MDPTLHICFLLLVAFAGIRLQIGGIIDYQLNKNALKKRKIGQTAKEWLLYSRFREEIPKPYLTLYVLVFTLHPLGLLLCVIAKAAKLPEEVCTITNYILSCFDSAWILLYTLMFRRGKDKRIRYERWIKRRRGQTPRKK